MTARWKLFVALTFTLALTVLSQGAERALAQEPPASNPAQAHIQPHGANLQADGPERTEHLL